MSTQNQTWAGSGYGVKGVSDTPLFFLSGTGTRARLRLVSEPVRYEDNIPNNGGAGTKSVKRVAWLAIHKDVSAGRPSKKVVVFQSTPMVYEAIRELMATKGFEDPTTYDILVTRTGGQSNYYTVEVVKNSNGPLTPADVKLVADSKIDLAATIAANVTDANGVPTATGDGSDPLLSASFD